MPNFIDKITVIQNGSTLISNASLSDTRVTEAVSLSPDIITDVIGFTPGKVLYEHHIVLYDLDFKSVNGSYTYTRSYYSFICFTLYTDYSRPYTTLSEINTAMRSCGFFCSTSTEGYAVYNTRLLQSTGNIYIITNNGGYSSLEACGMSSYSTSELLVVGYVMEYSYKPTLSTTWTSMTFNGNVGYPTEHQVARISNCGISDTVSVVGS